MKEISIPIPDEVVFSLKVGDPVSLNGIMITGRDTVHKWIMETFVRGARQPEGDDQQVYEKIKPLLEGGIIYHCGPVVSGLNNGDYRFVAAGPTTSTREEPYESDVMHHFNIKGVIGKGGMGPKTLQACQDVPGVYLHAIGGAASLIARSVVKVLDVYKLDFGVPEAMWVIEVKDFPVVVTMDAHGNSLHVDIEAESREKFNQLISAG